MERLWVKWHKIGLNITFRLNYIRKKIDALIQKGQLFAYPTGTVNSGFLSNQLLVSISACLKKKKSTVVLFSVRNINTEKKKFKFAFHEIFSPACLTSATSPTSVRCSSLLCVNFTQIEFNPIDPSAGRAPESSPPDTRSPSSARGGALPRTSHTDKQAACAVTDPAVPVWRREFSQEWVKKKKYIYACVHVRQLDCARCLPLSLN